MKAAGYGAILEWWRFWFATLSASPAGSNADEVLMRCLLVDDSKAFVETACRVLDPNWVKVTGTASNIDEALLRVSELRPDIVLIDVMLGDESGFDLARRLAELDTRDLAVIMTSSGAEDDYIDLMAESTALGFLPKAELSADGIWRLLGKVPPYHRKRPTMCKNHLDAGK
jgi:CheY-like chemotaxis protein